MSAPTSYLDNPGLNTGLTLSTFTTCLGRRRSCWPKQGEVEETALQSSLRFDSKSLLITFSFTSVDNISNHYNFITVNVNVGRQKHIN